MVEKTHSFIMLTHGLRVADGAPEPAQSDADTAQLIRQIILQRATSRRGLTVFYRECWIDNAVMRPLL